MANLRCHAYYCAYNDCTHCKHESPDVNDEAVCVSFLRRQTMKNGDPFLFEYAEDKRFSLKDDEHFLSCQSCSCINNHDRICGANHVRIDVSIDKAKCMNYRKKID